MSRDLHDLESVFKTKVVNTLKACGEKGYILKPFFTLRTPQEQAKLWRQSRDIIEINRMLKDLRETHKAGWIANIIEEAGPQYGKKVTNCLPGQSWHQWGLACDCFYSINGGANWDAESEGYIIYAHQAIINGLYAGRFWKSFRDPVHIQLLDDSVSDYYSWSEIDKLMEEKFCND